MNKVAITGIGVTDFTREDIPIENILLKSTKEIFDNTKNLQQSDIDAVLVSSNSNTKYLSAILSEISGISPKISHSVESLCNSGTNAIVSGYSYIASGMADVVLVTGGERYDSPGQVLEWDKTRGEFKHPVFWASLFTHGYKQKYSIREEDLAIVAARNHKNAQENPHAYSKKAYSVNDVINSKKLSEDLRVLDCSRPCTGASSVLLSSEKFAKKFTDTPIWISGIGQKTISASFIKNPSFSKMFSTIEASNIAYNQAKITPEDVQVAEIHDAFTVCEPLALEALGFTKEGEGTKMSKTLYETDNRMINPRGGILGTGHPLGATGIAQTVEIVQQLQKTAGKRQLGEPKIGLVQNMSAAATSSTVLVLKS